MIPRASSSSSSSKDASGCLLRAESRFLPTAESRFLPRAESVFLTNAESMFLLSAESMFLPSADSRRWIESADVERRADVRAERTAEAAWTAEPKRLMVRLLEGRREKI